MEITKKKKIEFTKIKNQELLDELKSTKEDLNDLEVYIREFSSFLPFAVCSINPLGIIIDINQAFQKLTGYGEMEIVGEFLVKYFLEKKKFKALLNKARQEGNRLVKELTLSSKKGRKIPIRASVSIRKNERGNFIGYFVGIADYTKIKRLQKDLREKVRERTAELREKINELEREKEIEIVLRIREKAKVFDIRKKVEELKNARTALLNILEDVEEERRGAEAERNRTISIISNFTDGLLIFDKEAKLFLINPKAKSLLKINNKRKLLGSSITDFAKKVEFKPILNLLSKDIKQVSRKELQIRRGLILEVSSLSIFHKKDVVGKLVILHDITREKLIEKMKTEFVSIAAHQLRTPLSAIKWTLKMLLDGDLGKITIEQKEFIKKTYQSNERMIGLINDLLNVSRIEEGRYLYKPILCNIIEIIQSVIDSLKQEIVRKKIIFKFKKPKEKLPQVKADKEKIKLAIQNLTENAIKYTKPGGKITIFLRHSKKKIEFEEKDTGVGIPKDQYSRIFTKFFRASNAIKMETEGSGLGLYIVKNIINAHGGKIWFKSKLGKGTSFFFELPIFKK